MAFHPLRVALYTALFIFSTILVGLTSSRIHRTRRGIPGDPLNPRRRGGFYEPVIAELLATSILGLLLSLLGMCAICAALAGAPYILELLALLTLWVLYLVGAAIATHYWHRLGWCRFWSLQCRVTSAIVSFSWIAWAITTFLLLASLASLLRGKHRVTDPLYGTKDEELSGRRGRRDVSPSLGAPETRTV